MEKDKQGLAITSFVLSIVGFWIFGIVLGIIAIITGALSWEKGLGKAGLIIGIIDVIGVLFFLGF